CWGVEASAWRGRAMCIGGWTAPAAEAFAVKRRPPVNRNGPAAVYAEVRRVRQGAVFEDFQPAEESTTILRQENGWGRCPGSPLVSVLLYSRRPSGGTARPRTACTRCRRRSAPCPIATPTSTSCQG